MKIGIRRVDGLRKSKSLKAIFSHHSGRHLQIMASND